MADYTNMTLEEKKQKLAELKSKLAQLKSTKELTAQTKGFDSAIDAMMPYDPNQAFNLMDRREATELKRLQALNKDQYDPDQVRFKLVSRMNSITGQLQGMSANDPLYTPLTNELKKIKAELNLDNPSVQHVYSGSVVDNNDPPPPNGTKTVTYETILEDIKGATKETYDKVAAQVATDKGIAKLSNEQTKYVDDALNKKYKELFPLAKHRPTTTNVDWLNPIKAAIGQFATFSAVSSLDPSVPSDRQILWKVNQRSFTPEAVNEGDLSLGRSFLDKAIAKITGIVPEISETEAISAKNNAKKAYDLARGTVKSYIDHPKNFQYISEGTYKWMTDALKTYVWANNKNLTDGLRTVDKTDMKTGTGEDLMKELGIK